MGFKLGEKVWTPNPETVETLLITEFTQYAADKFERRFADYEDLHKWSLDYPDEFWAGVAEFTQLKWIKPPSSIDQTKIGTGILDTSWFPDCELNFAENLMPTPDSTIRIISHVEGRDPVTYSGQQINDDVAKLALYLRESGLKKGDRVAAVVANVYEAVVAMLATTSLGGIWSSCSPDFGVQGIVDRFEQISPKFIFYQRNYMYGGKLFDLDAIIGEVLEKLSSVEHAITFSYLPRDATAKLNTRLKIVDWQECLSGISAIPELTYEPMSFSDPLYIMFSSGTTGKPKCIIHSVGGTLLQHKKELMLHCDIKPDDRLLYFTTCGWMMWNWMVSALSVGASLVLFDGSVTHPTLKAFWKFVDDMKVSCLGISPKFLSLCKVKRLKLNGLAKLEKLRTILSTGAPLLPEHFEFVYTSLKSDIHLASISGGTDIISCFMLGNPSKPVYCGEIQGPGLGMAVEVWDDVGNKLPDNTKGELVCTQAFPSMPVGFWGDDENQTKYRESYFNYFERVHVWRHGDFISKTANGGIVVYGRSDTTLNPGGIRIGTAEIYRVLENFPQINDSLVVGVPKGGDVMIVLFIKTEGEVEFANLADEVKSSIRSLLTPRHVPKFIFEIEDIPYTRSGKKVELAVKQVLIGEVVKNKNSLSNPSALEYYKKYTQRFSSTNL